MWDSKSSVKTEAYAGQSNYIEITGLKIFARHGVLPEEKAEGQDFYVNARLYYDMAKPGQSDRLEDALDYAEVCAYMDSVFTQKTFDLIEAAGDWLCRKVLRRFSLLTGMELTLEKPHAPIGLPFANVSVNMGFWWHKVYLSVGSNLGNSRMLIAAGIEELKSCPNIRNVSVTKLIATKPYGPVEQPDFLNGCVELETLFDPEELLAFLHEVEAHADRKREVHWGPRTLDMDIIFYDKLVYESGDLVIPHIDMEHREFVLKPLAQLCPNYRHPVLQKTVGQLLQEL